MRALLPRLFPLVMLVGVVTATPARADQATETARGHYETGLELFYAREHAQALVEFQRAHEVKPRPATLFMMAQCEYLLGSLRLAREHYEAYLSESPTGEFVEVAKDRIESINRRPATLVINSVPDQVDVKIVSAEPANAASSVPPFVVSGQAPNNFSVPRGRWLVSVSKPNFLPQQLVVQVSIAETKPLFWRSRPPRRAPRCTSTATAPRIRITSTSPPGASRSSPRRPTTKTAPKSLRWLLATSAYSAAQPFSASTTSSVPADPNWWPRRPWLVRWWARAPSPLAWAPTWKSLTCHPSDSRWGAP